MTKNASGASRWVLSLWHRRLVKYEKGIPAALVAITATLITLTGATSVPTLRQQVRAQASPQVVDTALVEDRALQRSDMSMLRASRSRMIQLATPSPSPVAPPAPVPTPVVVPVALQTQAVVQPQPIKKRQASVSRATGGSYAWANTTNAYKVANCESGDRSAYDHYNGNPHDRGNSRYRGKWQIGFQEWADNGGSGDPADATEAEQDYRAWLLWKSRGWQPWECASIMGVY